MIVMVVVRPMTTTGAEARAPPPAAAPPAAAAAAAAPGGSRLSMASSFELSCTTETGPTSLRRSAASARTRTSPEARRMARMPERPEKSSETTPEGRDVLATGSQAAPPPFLACWRHRRIWPASVPAARRPLCAEKATEVRRSCLAMWRPEAITDTV